MASIVPKHDLIDFPIKIVKHPAGHYCGYVFLPKGHRFYGIHYDEINTAIPNAVPYGLTYSNYSNKTPDAIPHELSYSEYLAETWWCVGFDTAHHFGQKEFYTRADVIDFVHDLLWQL